MAITAQQVKSLRERTQAGVLDCKLALQEAEGDFEKATVILRKKGLAAAAKRADRATVEGLIFAYIHPGDSLGVLVELNCETDFVAKTPEFRNLVKDIAMHVAALAPRYVRREDVPQGEIDQEKEIYRSKALASGKPEKIVERVVEGQLGKFFGEVCLLEQPFVKEPSITVGQLVADRIASTKENINLRRFVRFKLGEGLQKRSADFAGEVAAQLD
jgi:elongation factor Ts